MLIGSGGGSLPCLNRSCYLQWFNSSTNRRSLTSFGMTTFSSLAPLVRATQIVP
jgi:hypothetical protein